MPIPPSAGTSLLRLYCKPLQPGKRSSERWRRFDIKVSAQLKTTNFDSATAKWEILVCRLQTTYIGIENINTIPHVDQDCSLQHHRLGITYCFGCCRYKSQHNKPGLEQVRQLLQQQESNRTITTQRGLNQWWPRNPMEGMKSHVRRLRATEKRYRLPQKRGRSRFFLWIEKIGGFINSCSSLKMEKDSLSEVRLSPMQKRQTMGNGSIT